MRTQLELTGRRQIRRMRLVRHRRPWHPPDHAAPASQRRHITRQRLTTFAGWFVLGVLAFGVELLLLAVLYQWLAWPLWLASALAAELVLLGRFASTDRLVFGHRTPTFSRCWKFHASAIGSFAVSWTVLNGSAVVLDVQYAVAAFLGSVAAFMWSGLTNFLWVWRRPS